MEYEEIKRQIAILSEEVENNWLRGMADSEIGKMAGRFILKQSLAKRRHSQ